MCQWQLCKWLCIPHVLSFAGSEKYLGEHGGLVQPSLGGGWQEMELYSFLCHYNCFPLTLAAACYSLSWSFLLNRYSHCRLCDFINAILGSLANFSVHMVVSDYFELLPLMFCYKLLSPASQAKNSQLTVFIHCSPCFTL